MTELFVLPCDNAFVRYLTLISAFYLPLLGFGLFHFRKMLSPLHHKGPLLCLRVLSLLTSYPVSAPAKAKPSVVSGGGHVWRGRYPNIQVCLEFFETQNPLGGKKRSPFGPSPTDEVHNFQPNAGEERQL